MFSLLLIVSVLSPALVQATDSYGLIQFPGVVYVKPGDSFTLSCLSDYGGAVKIFLPEEFVPPHEVFMELASRLDQPSQKTIYAIEIENASVTDAGTYTCVVHHGPGITPAYTMATSTINVVDLCEGVVCDEATYETCTSNYETGAAECGCEMECDPMNFDPVCSDTCEQQWSPCAMRERTCLDKTPRNVLSTGFCPTITEPTTRTLNNDGSMDITIIEGEQITLASGLVTDGVPAAEVKWRLFSETGELIELADAGRYSYEFTPAISGMYEATLTHCRNIQKAVVNRYQVTVEPTPEEPTTTPTPTTTPYIDPDNIEVLEGANYVCSIYPAGVVETFSASADPYDMACSHVLASDVFNGGDYTNPWFIYGTFDKMDGETSLSSMTIHIGANGFEIKRGWSVNVGFGENPVMELVEGEKQSIGESGCTAVVAYLHLVIDCPAFTIHYDGIFAGHILLKGSGPTTQAFVKQSGHFGLCFDSNFGFRTNWQVGETDGRCSLDESFSSCSEEMDPVCDLYIGTPPILPDAQLPWDTTGSGAVTACHELNCGAPAPDLSLAMCSMEQAWWYGYLLKFQEPADALILEDVQVCASHDLCEWVAMVVKRGCPQKNPPIPAQCM